MAKSNNRNRTSSRQFGSGVMEMARERPMAAAAAAAAAVGAGVFLWSRRNQISDQLSDLSDQISEWSQNFTAGDDTGDNLGFDEAEGSRGTGIEGGTGRTATRGMSETGGGNANLGAHTGTTGSVSGRGRAKSPSTT